MRLGSLPLGLALLVAQAVASSSGSSYDELLTITPLADGKVHSAFTFNFTANSDHDRLTPTTQTTHSSLVPPLLTSLLDLYSLDSFSLTLSSGRWSPHWPPNKDSTSAASGIQLAAWLQLFHPSSSSPSSLSSNEEDNDGDRWTSFKDFSMQKLYDRTLHLACPVASSSRVELVIPVDSIAAFDIKPNEGHQRAVIDDKVVWDTSERGFDRESPLDVQLTWTEPHFRHPKPLPVLAPITTRRLLKGHGQERGEIGIELSNHLSHPVEVLWIERWPWWVRGFVGGLKLELVEGGGDVQNSSSSSDESSIISSLSYIPPIARRRPTTLSTTLLLPSLSTIRLLVPYESSYLWYTEYPADAHRGFEVPGAVTLLLLPDSQRQAFHTPSTLLSLPTPDFSMPYNVIILTSTAIALFFGSVVNPLRREWKVIDLGAEGEEEKEEGEKE
ncbi:hypothetical protein RQP46_001533 [Phenoliferia psychrophenolica]